MTDKVLYSAEVTGTLTITAGPKTDLDFGRVIAGLKRGGRYARAGWNGKGMWIELQVPDAHSKMSLPYIFMKTADDKLVPWLASQTDMMAEDWEVVA